MKKETIKEIGVINIDAIEVAEGCIEMRIPVEIVSQQLDNKLDKLFVDFEKSYPDVTEKNIAYEARMVFSLNRYNPEFTLMLIIFDAENQDTAEIWDELEVTLSEDAKKQFKKIAWEKLGEALFNL